MGAVRRAPVPRRAATARSSCCGAESARETDDEHGSARVDVPGAGPRARRAIRAGRRRSTRSGRHARPHRSSPTGGARRRSARSCSRTPACSPRQTVHLHLEQRVAQRLLGALPLAGVRPPRPLPRCLAQVSDSIPRVILLGRLSSTGSGAERLHEELVPVAARWVDAARARGPLSAYARDAEATTPRAAR